MALTTTITRLIAAFFIIAMGALAIAQLALVVRTTNWRKPSRLSRTVIVLFDPSRESFSQNLDHWPENFRPESTRLMYWTSIGAIVDMVLLMGVVLWRGMWAKKALNAVGAFICFVVIVRPLAVLIYAYVENSRVSRDVTYLQNQPFGRINIGPYPLGTFTHESWICGVSAADAAVGERDVNACNDARVARVLLIPLFVVSFVSVLCVAAVRAVVLKSASGKTDRELELKAKNSAAAEEALN